MQLSGILKAAVSIPVALRGIRGRNRELGCYLVQRMLRRRQAKLALEERGLGRVPVRFGEI
jgi:hypothetical protein